MWWFTLVLLCISMTYCDSTLVQYKSGTIIRQEKTLNTGSTSMHLVIKIPRLQNLTDYIYFRPCQYINMIRPDIESAGLQNAEFIMNQFIDLCKSFSRLKRINLHIKRTYQQRIDLAQSAIDLLTVQRRTPRSMFSAIRHIFNVADYDKQLKLKNTVNNIAEDIFTVNGEIVGLKFVISHEAEKTKQLQETVLQITDTWTTYNIYLQNVTDIINGDRMVNHYKNAMFFDLMQAGVLTNNLLDIYSTLLQERVESLALLSRHYLPPSLLQPTELEDILNKLENQLRFNHHNLRFQHDSVFKYYSTNNVYSFVENDNYYLQIPVLLKIYDQEFKLYSLEPFHLTVPNQPQSLIKVMHKPFIAVNKHAGTFMTLGYQWIDEFRCKGHQDIYCEELFTELYSHEKNCELSIVYNKTVDIQNNCNFAIVDISDVKPKVHYLGNNKILVENPLSVPVYQQCKDTNNKVLLSAEQLFEAAIPCFCWIFSDGFSTSLMTSDSCVTSPTTKTYQPMNNILYINLLLNTSQEIRNISLDFLPSLNLPKLTTDLLIDNDNNFLDLKDVLQARQSGYYHTVHNKLLRHDDVAKNFPLFRSLAICVPILAILATMVTLFFCVRTRKLGQLMSLMALTKNVEAAPLNTMTVDFTENFDLLSCIGVIIIFTLLLFYICIRYYKLFTRLRHTISLPFSECVSAREQPSWKLALYLSNFKTYCYLYVDNILQYPDSVTTETANVPLTVTLHDNWFNSFITLNMEDIHLQTEGASYCLPKAITVPITLKHTVKSILATSSKVEIMIGSGSHFRVRHLVTRGVSCIQQKQPEMDTS